MEPETSLRNSAYPHLNAREVTRAYAQMLGQSQRTVTRSQREQWPRSDMVESHRRHGNGIRGDAVHARN